MRFEPFLQSPLTLESVGPGSRVAGDVGSCALCRRTIGRGVDNHHFFVVAIRTKEVCKVIIERYGFLAGRRLVKWLKVAFAVIVGTPKVAFAVIVTTFENTVAIGEGFTGSRGDNCVSHAGSIAK